VTDKHPCSECGKLIPLTRITCDSNCRSKRARRKKRERKQASIKANQAQRLEEHQEAVAAVVRGDVPEVANELIKEELRPMVRDAITGEVLGAIKSMVNLAPQAVAALALDMQSSDEKVRQKAYELWFRYTVGQKDLHSPDQEQATAPITINFDMPRPDMAGEHGEEVIEEAEELRECEHCGEEKPTSEFIEGSTRCQVCHEALEIQVQQRLGKALEQ
jgi:hypothetical protein